MNDEIFEQRLRSHPMRQVPPGWRGEILANARKTKSQAGTNSFVDLLTLPFRELIWPARRIWTGLAATWLVIAFVNLSQSDKQGIKVTNLSRPSPELVMALKEQDRLLAELTGQAEIKVTEPPKRVVPQPRSERHVGILTA